MFKAEVGSTCGASSFLTLVDFEGIFKPKPVVVLQERSHQLRHRTVTQFLIQWQGEGTENATWENLYQLQQQFLTFWARCFNLGGVLLGMVCMLYNMMGCMAIVCDAEAVMQRL